MSAKTKTAAAENCCNWINGNCTGIGIRDDLRPTGIGTGKCKLAAIEEVKCTFFETAVLPGIRKVVAK